MKLKDIFQELEKSAPLSMQEEYDNSGLLYGDPEAKCKKVLVCLDITDEVLKEAIQMEANLIISHHPLVFRAIKKLEHKKYPDRILIDAIQNNIALYAMHSNLDNWHRGVNQKIGEKLGLEKLSVLENKASQLCKLVVFCPDIKLKNGRYAPGVLRNALFSAGAGHIGKYEHCSFNTEGLGTFRGMEGSHPFIGKQGKTHIQKEIKIEVIFPTYAEKNLIQKMKEVHPYEEIAYDIYPLNNTFAYAGAGMTGIYPEAKNTKAFLREIKDIFQVETLRHSRIYKKEIREIAFCGGSGSFLISRAKAKKADVFLSSDIKYHDFFQADENMMIVDIGHYQSEQFTIELIIDLLQKKFPKFAVLKTRINTNPIKYL
jgi:dinuclear metal center YbgI/SA1388 family protein